ncbi:MAG: hypothetical protein E7667_00165 [Ruminococcaceae bacterium]|nr:hypothetical protein [Oscillospiraceae bacterium]
MQKKKIVVLVLVLVAIILVCGIIIAVIKINFPKVKSFQTQDYQYYIENFSSDENVGSISNARGATKKAETVWLKLYGKNIKKEKPYQVFYDEKSDVWLVTGSMKSNAKGGVAHIIMEGDTGKVLAVWHEK